ncbi:MAG: ferritin-like domain-containing protein [Myxococcales bacterium]|jgi:ferritin-like protein
MGSENLHEPREQLSAETVDLHRGIVSLMEELEAVDWYQQRAEACTDPDLRAVLIHHRNEEIEHAIMNLEWLRRREPQFDAMCRTYLFTEAPVTEVEEEHGAGGSAEHAPAAAVAGPGPGPDGSLGIGSLRATAQASEEVESA